MIRHLFLILISLLIVYFLYRINKKRFLGENPNLEYINYIRYLQTVFNNPDVSVLDLFFVSTAIVSIISIFISLIATIIT